MNINQYSNINSMYQTQSTRSVNRIEKVTSEDTNKQQAVASQKGQDSVNISSEGRAALAASMQSQAVVKAQNANGDSMQMTSSTAKLAEAPSKAEDSNKALMETGVSALNSNSAKEEAPSVTSVNQREDVKEEGAATQAAANQYSRAANAYASNMKATMSNNQPMALNSVNA